jgi:hypothetical protein
MQLVNERNLHHTPVFLPGVGTDVATPVIAKNATATSAVFLECEILQSSPPQVMNNEIRRASMRSTFVHAQIL